MSFDGVGAAHGFAASGASGVLAVGEVCFHVSVSVADVGEGDGVAAVVEAVEVRRGSGDGASAFSWR